VKTPQEWINQYYKAVPDHTYLPEGLVIKFFESIQTDAHSDLLDRIKVLEGELDFSMNRLRVLLDSNNKNFAALNECRSLLHRCLNTGLRHKDDLPLYIEVCRVLGVHPDKPWEEK